MIGRILRSHYKVISLLGQGGFGTTYLAVDLDLPNHPKCVVKQLASFKTQPQNFKIAYELFRKEAIILQRLGEHDQIPRLFASFEAGEQFYLVQELVEGDNLTPEIHSGIRFSEKQTIKLLT